MNEELLNGNDYQNDEIKEQCTQGHKKARWKPRVEINCLIYKRLK